MLQWVKNKSIDLQGVIKHKDDPFSKQLLAKSLLLQFELFCMWYSCNICMDRCYRAYIYPHVCVCALGDLCEEVVDPCLPGFDPCQHDSKCVTLSKSYRYVCHLQGWKVRGSGFGVWYKLFLSQNNACVCVIGVSVCQAMWGSSVSKITMTVWRTSVSMGPSVWTPSTVTRVSARMVSGKHVFTNTHAWEYQQPISWKI